jgi:hypothetical protein
MRMRMRMRMRRAPPQWTTWADAAVTIASRLYLTYVLCVCLNDVKKQQAGGGTTDRLFVYFLWRF